MTDENPRAHFERIGKLIARSATIEPRPKDLRDLFHRMYTIDPNCGMGTEDPLGGDLSSHLAYIEYREAWVKRRGKRY